MEQRHARLIGAFLLACLAVGAVAAPALANGLPTPFPGVSTGPDGATWMTVGSSSNVLQASWYALADSLEYALVTWSDSILGTNMERVAPVARSAGA
jgi:hypothetical protein